MEKTITVRKSIVVNKPKEIVWDYTQNYDNRTKWDSSVLAVTVLQTTPNRIVKLKMNGNTTMIFIYKLDDRPNKTTLAATEIQSSLIKSGGGSWIYETKDNGTLWTQTNTIVFKDIFLLTLTLPFLRWLFNKQTMKAMAKAKNIIEQLDTESQ